MQLHLSIPSIVQIVIDGHSLREMPSIEQAVRNNVLLQAITEMDEKRGESAFET